MTETPEILLTNDDGIDALGLLAVYDSLSEIGETTVVAPQTDQSGRGRARSYEFTVDDHELGYAVDGTPCDCVNYGLRGLDRDFDVVVSGCNSGPNFGAHIIGRSGTVGAAKQAAFLGVPGIAISLYCHPDGIRDFDRVDYAEVETFVPHLATVIAGSETPGFDYVNVNVPVDVSTPDPVHITEVTHDCDIQITASDDGYSVYDPFYDPLRPDVNREMTDRVGTDRRAIANGAISITPLRLGGQSGKANKLSTLVDGEKAVF